MKVGDYVRTKRGEIGKIIDFINEPTDYYFNCYETTLKDFTNKYITEDSDIKSSPNIIDLIEVGDYVNGGKVYEKEQNYVVINNDFGNLFEFMNIYENDIKSIVTKEQFESIEYKVGE